MAGKRFGGTRFYILGALYGFAVMGALGVANLMGGLPDSPLFLAGFVVAVVLGAALLVWLTMPKS
jgi:hypothetical protein